MPRLIFSFILFSTFSINLLAGQVTFTAGGNSPLVPNTAPVGVNVADFNGDGKQDLFVVCNNANASLSLGLGDGTFGAPTTIPVGGAVRFAAVGDFNGDGKLDIAVCKPASLKIGILLNNGSGGFAPIVDITTDDTPYSVISADFNGDQKLDLAIASNGLGACVYLGKGDGTFNPREVFTAGGDVIDIAAGKFNDDDILDLAVVNMGDDTVSILIGAGDGSFAAPVDIDAGDEPYGIVVGDLNNDTITDIAVTNLNSRAVTVLFGEGNGAFNSNDTLTTDGDTPISMAIQDVNGDGFSDLMVLNCNGQSFQVYMGSNSGLISDGLITNPNGGVQIASGDFNRDLRPDFVTANFGADNVSVYLNAFSIPQTVTFAPIADRVFGSAPFNVAATASSGKPVTISILSGPATIAGNTITLTGAGTVTVRASQLGAGFLQEAHVDRMFNVGKGTPTIAWTAPAPITVGNPLTSAQLNATVDATGTLNYNPPLGTLLSIGANQTLSVTFVPENSDNYFAATQSVLIAVLSPAVPPGSSDSDGDGYSDAIEVAAGSSPSEFNDRPYGMNLNPAKGELTDVDLAISLNFARAGKDKISVSGVLNVSSPGGESVPFAIEVGGVAKAFSINAKGRGRSGKDSIRIAPLKGKDASVFDVNLNQGSFAAPLLAHGLNNETNKKVSVTVPVTVLYANKVFASNLVVSYTSKKGRSGSAR